MTNKIRTFLVSMILPLFTIGIFLLVFILYLPSQAAPDGAFIVNTDADTDDGACDGTNCTLREAINTANATAGFDTIAFSLPPNANITLAGSQLPTIIDYLAIDGSASPGITIRGANITRTFTIGNGTNVTMTNITIGDGWAVSGGAIYNDGGTLNINNCTIENNVSDDVFLNKGGGGIYNQGELTINNCTITGNLAGFAGGGLYNFTGTVNISNSSFIGNATDWIFTLAEYTLGGAIYNDAGTVTIVNSTFSGNYCRAFRGTCDGGGIANKGALYIYNNTFSGNSAASYPGPGGGGIRSWGNLNLSNTIIANSGGGDCIGNINTSINNLIEDGNCNPFITGDPLLEPLQDNGGPTWTYALTAPSPAVDAGDDGICAAQPVNNLDQRGVTRPLDGDGEGTPKCDIGAYEYDGPPPFRSLWPVVFRN